jgi:hypothetical protein
MFKKNKQNNEFQNVRCNYRVSEKCIHYNIVNALLLLLLFAMVLNGNGPIFQDDFWTL